MRSLPPPPYGLVGRGGGTAGESLRRRERGTRIYTAHTEVIKLRQLKASNSLAASIPFQMGPKGGEKRCTLPLPATMQLFNLVFGRIAVNSCKKRNRAISPFLLRFTATFRHVRRNCHAPCFVQRNSQGYYFLHSIRSPTSYAEIDTALQRN